MKVADYVYYCIYRFVLKTPARSYADAWPIAFLALMIGTHVLLFYWLFAVATGRPMAASLLTNKVCVTAMIVLIGLLFWRYVMNGHGARVISSYEKRGNEGKFARVGAIMFFETLLMPLTLAGLLIFGA